MSDSKLQNVNLDDLLEGTLDDLADMPEFKLYPNGAHKVTIHFKRTEINSKPAIEVKLKGIETLELTDKAAVPITAGDETNALFFMDNELGQGQFKNFMRPLIEHFKIQKLGAAMEAAEGAEVAVVTKQNYVKKTDKTYQQFVEVAVV